MTTTWWQELIGGIVLALPGVTALVLGIIQLIQKNKDQKVVAKKTDADIEKEKQDQENELIKISRQVTGDLITKLEIRVTNLHSALQDLEKRYAESEERNDVLEKRVGELEEEVASKNRRIIELEKSEAEKDKRIKELEDKVYALEHPEEKK